MGSVLTAAFDPIFWVHHANVDRLWAEWSCLPDRSWGARIPVDWLDEQPWSFHDVDRVVRTLPRRAYFNCLDLGYSYPTTSAQSRPLELPVAVASETSPQAAPISRRREIVTSADQVVSVAADRPASVTLPAQQAALHIAPAAPAREGASFARMILELLDVEAHGPPTMRYDVYVNRPESTDLTRRSPFYVGSIALFGLEPDVGHDHGERVHRFDATKALAASSPTGDVKIEIIPLDLLVPQPGEAPIRRGDSISVRSFRFVRDSGSL